MRTVAYSSQSEEWVVRGKERQPGVNGELVLTKQDLPHIKAVDLKAALVSHAGNYHRDDGVAEVSEVHEDYYDPEYGGGQISFELRRGNLLVSVVYFSEWPEDHDEDALILSVRKLVVPLLKHLGASLDSIEVDYHWCVNDTIAVRFRLQVPWHGRTLDRLFVVGEDVLRLCDAFGTGEITRDSVADLVRGGCAGLLVGQPEGHWLDVKSQEYDLTSTHGKIGTAARIGDS